MKKWLCKWLGIPTPPDTEPGVCAPKVANLDSLLGHGGKTRTTIELVDAVNGKIVVLLQHTYNPNGPDDHRSDVYLVPEGENLMDTVATAIVTAKLK